MISQLKKKLFLLILFLFLVIAVSLILRSGFSIGDTFYFVLMDDQMISMRYAKNLAEGNGLVWNPNGERIEGFTNLLWTLYMALLHTFPIPASKISLAVQISNVVFMLINLFFVKKTSELIFNKIQFITLLSVLFVALYIPLMKWGIYGTEVSILTLLTTISVYLTCLSIKKKTISFSLFFLLGLGVLIRLDFATIAGVILFYLFIKVPEKRKFFAGLGIFLLLLLSQTIFRLLYYGDIVPNTYYLKMTGYPLFLRITTGIYTFLLFLHNMGWILFFVPFLTFLKKNKYTSLLFLVFAIQIIYSVYVGGDMGEQKETGSNRFLSLVMPLFFILFSGGLYTLKEVLHEKMKLQKKRFSQIVLLSSLIAMIAAFNSLLNPVFVQNFIAHTKIGYVAATKYNTIKGLVIDEITYDNAKIAVEWAGTTPYFSQRDFIDLLGKSDKTIAAQYVHPTYIPNDITKYFTYNPGHTKWNYAYSIDTLKPDITDHPGNGSDYEYVIFEGGLYLYLLKDSPNINWEKVQTLRTDMSKFN